MYAPKLKVGDGVRVIAPARSLALSWLDQDLKDLARRRLEGLGLNVSFGRHVNERDAFDSSSITQRIEDLHEAFVDPSVKIVLTVIGGYNSNQLLRHIDYSVIAANPKILCGFSDITVLASAIFARTGLVTYSGPHFFNFGQKQLFEYTLEHFVKCLFEEGPITLRPSEAFIDERWAVNQEAPEIHRNAGWRVLQNGKASGTLLGGNLGSLHLLQGTEYMLDVAGDIILLMEDDHEDHPAVFDRHLQSLLHQPLASRIRGVVIGRCEGKSGITAPLLDAIIRTKPELRGIPIIADVDFGHTTPMITFPIGGKAAMEADIESTTIHITEH